MSRVPRAVLFVPAVALVLVAMAPRARAADATAGKRVYDANCTACHGAAGDGNGPAAIALTPKPRSFRDATWWDGKTDATVIATIKAGRPGTAMTPFALSDADLEDVYAYIKGFDPAP